MTRLATPISSNTHPKNFWSIFNLCEFVSTCKRPGFFYLFWRYGWLKNTAIWLNENILAHISQIFNLCRNIANNINFHYRTNSVKINDNFSINSKNHVFGPFLVQFLYFGGKNFSGKSGSLMHNFIWVSSTMPKLRKN